MLLSVEQWSAEHPRHGELRQFVEEQAQTDWFDFAAPGVMSSRTVVAIDANEIIGFLRLVLQEVGPDMDRTPVRLNGAPVVEAKVMAFAVAESARNNGVGRSLQIGAINWAKELGCYQLRSYSSGDNAANHALKLKMGFAVHPDVRPTDREGLYFVMPLQVPESGDQLHDES